MSNDPKPETHVEALIKKAAEAHSAGDAQAFSQAANNAANALCTLKIANKN